MKYNSLRNKPLEGTGSAKATLSTLARKAVGGIVTIDEAAPLLGVSRRAASLRLAALARRGWLKRVHRGFYYVLPLESGAEEAVVAPDPWVLAFRLYSPCYIGGWSAAEHWGQTEQLFRSTFVVTNANIRKRSVRTLGTEFHLVRVRTERPTGIVSVWHGAVRVPTSDRERTIADALIDPGWLGGVRHLVDVLLAYVAERKTDFPKILEHLERAGRASAIKRLGFLAETLLPEESVLIISAHARRSTGVIRLDPSVKDKGRLSKRWGLWINVSLPHPNDS